MCPQGIVQQERFPKDWLVKAHWDSVERLTPVLHPFDNRFAVTKFPGKPVEELKNHLRVRKRYPAFVTKGNRIVEHVIYLDHAIVRVGSVGTWYVVQYVARPADVAFSRAIFELSV